MKFDAAVGVAGFVGVALFAIITFPGCPVRTVTVEKIVYKPVPVEQGCKLPVLGTLPKVTMQSGPNGLRCLDLDNRARLAERLSRLRQWVEITKTRCGAVTPRAAADGAPSAPESSDMPGKGERGTTADGGE